MDRAATVAGPGWRQSSAHGSLLWNLLPGWFGNGRDEKKAAGRELLGCPRLAATLFDL